MVTGVATDRQVAVVTGGAKGIGRATALRLASIGHSVAILDLDDAGQATADEICASGGRAVFARTDVSDPEQVTTASDVVRDELGDASILVNNAAIWPRAVAADMPWELWQRVIGVNLGGVFLCSRTFAAHMMRLGGGAIVNVSSGAASAGSSNGAHYTAAKGGVISLTKSLAREWAPAIRVNVVLPGLIDTGMPLDSGLSREDVLEFGSKSPMGRVGQPDDIAAVLVFLVGPDAGYMTGASVSVNGGALMV
jgi:NAD(P)-dependent dehydrogenase (short-subunit alcohol dehydrogenase family)